MQKNTISVVIPVLNESAYIDECLSALQRQTIPVDEIIVVDNNSTDDTLKIIAQSYPEVRVLHEPHQGIVYARNRGFNAAKGSIIARIDADTQVGSDWVSRLHHDFANSDVRAVGGQVWYYDRPFQRIATGIDRAIRKSFAWSAGHQMLQGCNMAVRGDAWRAVRAEICIRNDIHEDMDLGLHLARVGQQIDYDKQLIAGISARRLDTPLGDFWRYIGKQLRTYRLHGNRGLLGAIALCIIILNVYFINVCYALLTPRHRVRQQVSRSS